MSLFGGILMHVVEWNDTLSVGVAAIDDEHKRFVSYLNELYDAVQNNNPSEVLGQTLENLVAYAIGHFNHEELLFSQTDYPDADEHKKQHDELLGRVATLKGRYRQGTNPQLVLDVLEFLYDWLTDHLMTYDKKFGPYLNARGIR
jgi:hemerythrin